MSADDAAHGEDSPARRGRRARRPAAAKAATPTRPGRKKLGGPELTRQLNEMVAELIKENRKLKRQVVKLTERGSKVAATAVEKGLRTIQRRVLRALTGPTKRRKRKTVAAGATRKRTVTKRRRKST